MRFREPELYFDALLNNSERFEKELRSRWKDFIAKKLDGYSEQERKLEEDVAKTTQAYDEQIGGMIKSLTDSGLAAAAAVIGSFLVAFYKQPFDPVIFSYGLRIYALYVLVFPLVIGLSHYWGRFNALNKEFEGRQERIKKWLDETRVKDILESSQLGNNRMRFRRWFGAAFIVYCVLVISALAGAHFLPTLIEGPPTLHKSTGGSIGARTTTLNP
jgi:hypothetical protein